MEKKKEVLIVGAGPGGLTAGMPTIYESARISVNLYTGSNI